VLDAFNGDSPPIHLITVEAFSVYRRHLKDDGVLAVNISNKFLNFESVVRNLGTATGMRAVRIDSPYDFSGGTTAAQWKLLSAQPGTFDALASKATPAPPADPGAALWTDDYANVLSILR
jgi:spermidine synthase